MNQPQCKTGLRLILPADGHDVYIVLGHCWQTLKCAGMDDLWPALRDEALAGDRKHFNQVLHDWFDVDFGEPSSAVE